MRPLRVGLNLLYLVPGATGGMEVYARQLVPELLALRPGEPVWAFASAELSEELREAPWGEELRLVALPVSGRGKGRRVAAEQTLLPAAAARAGVTVLHSLGTTAPALTTARSVVTVHDLIYKRFPDTHRGLLARGMSVLVPMAVRGATRVIAISESARTDLRELLAVPDDKIDVVFHGPGAESDVVPTDERTLREALGLGDRPIVFSPSAGRAHKNLDRLIEAIGRLTGPEAPVLVVSGYATGMEGGLLERARAAGVEDRVRLTGWLPGADLEGLYRHAALMAFPSLAEGFGFPVIEAMRRGTPVLASDAPAVVEVAGGAALIVDGRSVDALAGGLERLLADPELRAQLAGRGRERAAELSWRRAAELTLASYRKALAA